MQNGIYKRPDSPYWWATWTDSSGRPARRSTRVLISQDPKGKEAARVRAKYLGEEPAPPKPQAQPYGWDELVTAYMDGPMTRKAASTQKGNSYCLRNLLAEFSGANLLDINGARVRAYIAKRAEEGANQSYIRNECALMGAITQWAIVDLEWPIPNPWARRKPAPNPPRDRWLTREEEAKLLEAADQLAASTKKREWIGDFIRLCLYTGMRHMEAVNLTWDRVGLDDNLIRFRPQDQKSRKAGSIPINRTARLVLVGRRAKMTADRVFPKVWPDHLFKSAVKMAGLTDVRIHDLRRTFGSRLAQEGVPIQQISQLMRHGDITVTHKTYAHLAPSTLADAASVLDDGPKLKIVK